MTYLLKLSCGHKVVTGVELMLQYHNDVHFILCPTCRGDARVPIGWNEVTSIQRMHSEKVRYVYGELPLIMPKSILRLQPRVHNAARLRPFPYVKGVKR